MTSRVRWWTQKRNVRAALPLVGALPLLMFLTWDTEYYWDDSIITPQGTHGAWQGPYEPWQVVACGATYAVFAAVATWRVGALSTILLMPLGATAAWFIPTLPTLGGGLALVGGLLMYVGTLLGTSVVSAATLVVRRILRPRSPDVGTPPPTPA